MARAATRTARLELRAEPERERRIRYAAELTRQSVSAFVLAAAAERAEEVITSTAVTAVPARFFAELWAALGERPKPNRALARRAAGPRRFRPR